MWALPASENEGYALHVINRMRDWDRREIFAAMPRESDTDLLALVLASQVSVVAGREDEPIALYGALQMWPGVWSMWFLATDNLRKIGKSVTRHILADILPSLFGGGAHRLECRSMEGHTEAHAWLDVLGARREGTNYGYGRGGENYHVYVWGNA